MTRLYRDQPRGRSRRLGGKRRWSPARTFALATLVVAAAIPTQAVLSEVPDAGTAGVEVDPDCLPPDDPSGVATERDGVCPDPAQGGNPSPPPGPAPEPAPKPTPLPARPVPTGGAGGGPTPAARAPATEVTRDETGDAGNGRRPSPGRRGSSRRTEPDTGNRRAGRRGHRRGTRRRDARRRHKSRSRVRRQAQRAKRRSAGPRGVRPLEPIPGWARSLLTQPLPDPLPAGKRLDPSFARVLERVAARSDVSWPLLLAILRARGNDGAEPATEGEIRGLARRLAKLGANRRPRRAVETLSDARAPTDPAPGIGTAVTFTDQVLALAGYHRAVGMRGLVRGLDAVKPAMIERVLASGRVGLYAGGRADVKAGRIDGRVLVLLLYLVHRHDRVTVSSLQSGHSFFTKSGNVSAHSYGRAVDVAALDGVSIAGHQDAGGVTERALWSILLLPEALRPSQLISLFDLGGPSFAMADHADHIHVGY